MKCIKCSYTSFDFNQACPKCGKDLSTETEKLHLPPYKPNPPYLLTSFTGETGGFEHSMGNEPAGVPSFLENQNEDIFMLDKNRLDSSENLRESSLNDGENELMVALDELSFEYEPAMEHGSKTPDFPMNEDLFMPEILQKEDASSTESVLFDTQITEDASPFAPIDEEESYSGIFDKIETPGATKIPEGYLELDLSDINQVENQPEEDELLISLDDLSFDQEPVSSEDFLEREPADKYVLSSVPENLVFGEKNSQDQSQNLEDYIQLDLSDMDQAESLDEDNNGLNLSFDDLSLAEGRSGKPLPATDSNKGGKKKPDLENDFIDLDLLEMEVDREDS